MKQETKNLLTYIWAYIPSNYKKKAMYLALIGVLICAFIGCIGFYLGVEYGIEHAMAVCNEAYKNCLCPVV